MCVCRSLHEEAQLTMEPIAEENIELPEAQTDTESRDTLRYFNQHTHHTHSGHTGRLSMTFHTLDMKVKN